MMMNNMMKKIAIAAATMTMTITAAFIASANETKYVSNDIGVNVRQSASADSQRLGGLNKGEKVDVISTENGWAKISYNGGTAYVTGSCLSTTKPETSYGYASGITSDGQIQTNNAGTPSYVKTTEKTATKTTYTVKVDGYLALRSEPAFNYSNEIGQLHTGDTVEFRENYGTYWCVYVPSTGTIGFVNCNYLE